MLGPSPAPPTEVRVLLLHHSPSYGETFELAITPDSKQALSRFVADCQVRVLLSGHIHKVAFHAEDNWLEARCGTSTQIDRAPRTRPDKAGKWDVPLNLNTFLVHRIVSDSGALYWEAETFQYVKTGGFQPTGQTNRLRL